MHREGACLADDGDQDAAAGRAVELGHDEAGDPGALAENVDLRERVLAGGGVEHEQHVMRARWRPPCAGRARSWRARSIRPSLFCRPPGGVDEQHVGAFRVRARVIASKARPAASAPAARATTGAPVRSPQIPSCSMAAARNVSPAASITGLTFALKLRGELADGRRLAVPLTPTIEDDEAACAAAADIERLARPAPARVPTSRLSTERTSSALISLSKRSLAQRRSMMFCGRADAEIGLDEQILEIFQRRRIELLLGEDAGNAVGELSPTSCSPALRRPNQPVALTGACCRRSSAGVSDCCVRRPGAVAPALFAAQSRLGMRPLPLAPTPRRRDAGRRGRLTRARTSAPAGTVAGTRISAERRGAPDAALLDQQLDLGAGVADRGSAPSVAAPFSRSCAAPILARPGAATCGMRAAGVPSRGENGNTCK